MKIELTDLTFDNYEQVLKLKPSREQKNMWEAGRTYLILHIQEHVRNQMAICGLYMLMENRQEEYMEERERQKRAKETIAIFMPIVKKLQDDKLISELNEISINCLKQELYASRFCEFKTGFFFQQLNVYDNIIKEKSRESKNKQNCIVFVISNTIWRNNMLGKIVKVTVDRPMGTYHPKHKDIYYPINYGYIEACIGNAVSL